MHIRNLPLLGSLFLSGLLAFGACSSSSSSGTGGTSGSAAGSTGSLAGTSGSTGGTTGAVGGTTGAVGGTTGAVGGHVGSAGGSTGTGAGGATVSCGNIPACVATLLSGCNSGGTCTTNHTTTSTGITNTTCYSNGVKSNSSTMIDVTTQTYTSTTVVSKNGATCYSYDSVLNGAGGASGSDSITLTFKNAQGTVVGTLTESEDASGNTLDTVTCGGQTTTVTDLGACDMPSTSSGNGGASGSAECTTSATCTP